MQEQQRERERSSVRAGRRRAAVALGVAAASILMLGGTAGAGEATSGGGGAGGGGSTACSPVSSLTVKADPRVGETGLATIDVSYGVKPCVNGQVVRVQTTVAEYLNPSVVLYDNPAALLNGKFTVAGVRLRVTYKVTVAVYDTATGTLAGSANAFTAAIPKGV